jgi:hypothetical protein
LFKKAAHTYTLKGGGHALLPLHSLCRLIQRRQPQWLATHNGHNQEVFGFLFSLAWSPKCLLFIIDDKHDLSHKQSSAVREVETNKEAPVTNKLPK